MISDLGIWTIVINLIAIAFAVQYSRTETFREALFWLVWDFSGLRFVWEKINPPLDAKPKGYRPPATIAVWVFSFFSVYFALYGFASQRYENAVDKIENRMNVFITQLAVVKNPKLRMEAFSEVNEIQKMNCPIKPLLRDPSSVILSFFIDDIYDETQTVLIRTVEKYKDDLKGVYLSQAYLKGANLYDAHLEGANLNDANLEGANLSNAHLEGAKLNNANLEGAELYFANLEGAELYDAHLESANLNRANLKGAELRNAHFEGARLFATNLEGANLSDAHLKGARLFESYLEAAGFLTVDQLCSTGTLYRSRIDPEFITQVNQQCPETLKNPK